MGALNYIVLCWVLYQLNPPKWVWAVFFIASVVDWLIGFLERMAEK